jgi:hypothetical protein
MQGTERMGHLQTYDGTNAAENVSGLRQETTSGRFAPQRCPLRPEAPGPSSRRGRSRTLEAPDA